MLGNKRKIEEFVVGNVRALIRCLKTVRGHKKGPNLDIFQTEMKAEDLMGCNTNVTQSLKSYTEN